MKLKQGIDHFLFYCQYERNLAQKTIKAYGIDLKQYVAFMEQESQNNSPDYFCFCHTPPPC